MCIAEETKVDSDDTLNALYQDRISRMLREIQKISVITFNE